MRSAQAALAAIRVRPNPHSIGRADGARRGRDQRGWTRLASGPGSRASKYRHLLDQALGLDDAELALLAVLMLRGPQTPGELKQRTERLHGFADLSAIHEALDGLIEKGHVERLPRRPGQKEERYRQLLGGDEVGATTGTAVPAAASEPVGESAPSGAATSKDRLDRVERELAELRDEVRELRDSLGG